MFRDECGDVLGEMSVENRVGKYGYAATRLPVHASEQALETVCMAQKTLRFSVRFGPLFGQMADPTSAANEEAVADLSLELIDVVTDGGRGDIQQVGAGAEASGLDDSNEHLEPAKCHSLHEPIPSTRSMVVTTVATAVIKKGYHIRTE